MVSEKDTKITILQFVAEQEKKIKALENGKVNIAVESKMKGEQLAISKATDIAKSELDIKINEVGALVTNELTGLLQKITEKKADLQALNDGIDLTKKEVEEVSQIKVGVYSLAAIINAATELKTKFDLDKLAREAEENKKLDEIKKLVADTKAKHDLDEKEFVANLNKLRKQESVEFDYNLARARKIEADKYADAEIAKKKELLDREASITLKEKDLKDREIKIDDLEKQVAAHPKNLDKAFDDGVAKAHADHKTSAAISESWVKKAHESDLAIKDSEIKHLTETKDRQAVEITELNKKLETAYMEIKNIASETVKSHQNASMLSEVKSFMREEGVKTNNQK